MKQKYSLQDSGDCTTIPKMIYAALAESENKNAPRPHLGASLIGHHCDRYIWISFLHAIKHVFPGRVLRLFRRGHLEEASVYADLAAIGFEVLTTDPATGLQWAFADGHFAGSCDGIITNFDPAGTRTLLEIKTHSSKSFADLLKHGVTHSKPQHYAQMQVYCRAFDCAQALYFAVCKDTDDIYTEVVPHDPAASNRLFSKAHTLIHERIIPPPISSNPTWYKCKMCDAHEVCHGPKATVQANCRTCTHSRPVEYMAWHCDKWGAQIPGIEEQMAGCGQHEMHPDLAGGGAK